ncbi:MAG: NUDIX hydrolase [Acholeplasmataceae bacterium]
MRAIEPIIIEEGLESVRETMRRTTSRALILNDRNEVLMVYSFHFDDYTFAGGGRKSGETAEETLLRELKEELGAVEVRNIRPFGRTTEIRYGIRGDTRVFRQTSDYFLCDVRFGNEPVLGFRERTHGVEPRWVRLDDAIAHNERVKDDERHRQKGLRTVLIRENTVLKLLKKERQL